LRRIAQFRYFRQAWLGQQCPSHEGIALEENVPLVQQSSQLRHIQGLHITPHIHDHVIVIGPELFNAAPIAKVIIHSIHLTRSRIAIVIQHNGLQGAAQLRIEARECLVQRTLADTRRSGKNDQSPFSHGSVLQ
jgi:hypothetical protein